jgi:phage-related protein (TIGR01555 family)
MQDSYQGVFKIRGYMDMISAADTATQNAPWIRYGLLDKNRSNARAVILDAENEEFERNTVSFGSMPEVLDRMSLNLAAACGIPVTLLMQQSPSGLNSTGENDVRKFYDTVKAEQENQIAPKLNMLVEALMLSSKGPTGGQELPGWSIQFPPLWQATEQEQADARKSQAETDAIYLQSGVLTAQEVADSRFGTGKYSFETNISNEIRIEPSKDNVE